MNPTILKSFIELAAFDEQFFNIEAKVAALQKQIVLLNNKLSDLDNHFAALQAKYAASMEQFEKQESLVQDLQNQESHLQLLSKNLTKAQDCQAANKDLEALKINRNQQEHKMVLLGNKVTTMNKDLQIAQKSYHEEQQKIYADIHVKEAEIKEAQENLHNFYQERAVRVQHLPSEWLTVYQTMRNKVANPFVPATQDSCSACFYFMSSYDLQQLHVKGILQCKDCFRFIYLEK